MEKDFEVIVYTMTNCQACLDLKDWLKEREISFVEKDIVSNEEYETEFRKKGLMFTPTSFIDIDNETHKIVGPSPKKFEKILSSELISK